LQLTEELTGDFDDEDGEDAPAAPLAVASDEVGRRVERKEAGGPGEAWRARWKGEEKEDDDEMRRYAVWRMRL
jgi:hypothetical protein